MTDGFTVRRAELDDLASIVELRLSLLREYGDHPLYGNLRPDAAERAESLFRSQLLATRETMFVAERGDAEKRVIGVLRCVDTPISPLLLPERYCYISSVFVRPEERRQGVLRALLGAAEAWCDERGLDEIRLHNVADTAAAEAWSALGFETVEEVRRRPLRARATGPEPVGSEEHAAVP